MKLSDEVFQLFAAGLSQWRQAARKTPRESRHAAGSRPGAQGHKNRR